VVEAIGESLQRNAARERQYRLRGQRALRKVVPGGERPELSARLAITVPRVLKTDYPMRSGCLWLLGVPIPIIILLWLITGHA
jgi:hypothetical protein